MHGHARWLMLLATLAGCASQPAPPTDLAVGGRLNLGRGQIQVTINDEVVIQGPLRLRGPMAPFGFGRSSSNPFPLRGEYRGQQVEVECWKQPIVGDPLCHVELAGRRIATLIFDPEGWAGTASED